MQNIEDCFERPPEVNIWSSLKGDLRQYVLEGENNEAYWENFRYSVRVLASKEEPIMNPGENFYSSISFTINVQDWGSLLTDSKFWLAVDWRAPVEEHVNPGTGEITVDSKILHANSCGYCVVHLGDTFLPAGQGHTERVLYNDLSFYAIDEQSAEYGGLAFVGWDQSFSYRADINISDERRKSLSNTVGNVAFMLLGIAATLFFETLVTSSKSKSRVSG